MRADYNHLAPWTLIKPAANVCQDCAVDHPPTDPHDPQSLYYQYSFYASHDRWPTWKDAMAHCAENVKASWASELLALGEVIE